jgi:hypothetical protein
MFVFTPALGPLRRHRDHAVAAPAGCSKRCPEDCTQGDEQDDGYRLGAVSMSHDLCAILKRALACVKGSRSRYVRVSRPAVDRFRPTKDNL